MATRLDIPDGLRASLDDELANLPPDAQPQEPERICWVNDVGSLGATLDFDDMQSALDRLALARPGS